MKAVSVPTDRIAQAISPANAQRSEIDAVNDATRNAADFLKAHCPTDPTLTPPGRVAAMGQRLNAILEAIKIVQPALENFYGSLTDEQKARFNLLGSQQGGGQFALSRRRVWQAFGYVRSHRLAVRPIYSLIK